MERSGWLKCLADDYQRLRSVAATDLTAQVPSCPDWTAADLVRHVGAVYLHKATAIRQGDLPDPWPPAGLESEEPIALLDRAYGELTDQIARHGDNEPVWTWHEPDQTVRFWIRRMAQETVIHRIDAELALGAPVAPIPDDLAADGIDEVLKLFVGYGSHAWREKFEADLTSAKGRTVAVELDGGPAWLVRTDPDGVTVTGPSSTTSSADATASGYPATVLRWLWARESAPTADAQSPVRVDGDEEALAELRRLLATATQ
ncbi:maleylpyruvate isomerase family mycothiol-dependent enzyme [Dactylosporangium fulvum]|uniref:Maleylpyruvate isomerase family mycothiol-dependent enzyme n=1 Tax=Dactylosporangium fulvum TaxID=53359 RepID=A0ABY5VYT1_9ACTN|nr:maleylpyruvate isomerase N-terminal domain-containing protein [Dactylosporangium fulvum]UWP82280.1 maleylpyruvate isomerase family mycothiol-dependent enzyme [Dactylosporangium fulvum]